MAKPHILHVVPFKVAQLLHVTSLLTFKHEPNVNAKLAVSSASSLHANMVLVQGLLVLIYKTLIMKTKSNPESFLSWLLKNLNCFSFWLMHKLFLFSVNRKCLL